MYPVRRNVTAPGPLEGNGRGLPWCPVGPVTVHGPPVPRSLSVRQFLGQCPQGQPVGTDPEAATVPVATAATTEVCRNSSRA